MNKSDLVDRVASSLGATRGEAAQYLDAVLEGITRGLIEDGRVKITAFGGFTRRHRAERNGTKPTTGEPIRIPASETCGFKAAPALRERLTESARPPGQVESKPTAHQDAAR
ncbi:MAG: HU family DNA-binding protein [Phycisphaera sp.]|nr:MAG: HU family DNA-binding protein [Phycisphaera sp.]